MLRKLLTIAFIAVPSLMVQGQISFSQTTVPMGQLLWYTNGETNVVATNKGNKPVTIKAVETSSSQLKTDWDKKAIPAGGTTTLRLTMDGSLLGHFEKAVYVYADDREKPYIFKVEGNVVRERDNYTGEYAYNVGDLQLSTDNIEFDDASMGDMPEQIIEIKNGTKQIYRPELMHLPPYLTATAEPDKLLPGRSGRIVVTLDTKQLGDYGLKQATVYLSRFPGDKVSKENEIAFSAVLLPPFDTTSVVQTELAPHLEISTRNLELPSLSGKSKVRGVVSLKNTGKSSLEIRSLQVFNPAINVDLSKTKIAPGRTQKLKISVLSKYMNRSRSHLRVLMITNDPKNPKVIVNVKLAKS